MPKDNFTIYIEELTFLTIVGILDHERVNAQKVVVNVQIDYLKESGYFINYADVAKLVEKRMQSKKFLLLEDALSDITAQIKLQYPPVNSIKLKISKPDIVDNCDVAVEVLKNY